MKKGLFVCGGPKIRSKRFGYLAPVGREELMAVVKVLKSGRLSGFYENFLGGEKVQEFEKNFAEYIGVKNAIALNSGTSALHVALAAAGVGPGDEVIIPALSFTATASAVLMNNAIPVFVDIEPDTLCIDPQKIKDAVSKNTKAVVPVHLYGKVAKLNQIKEAVKGKDISIIEDSCQSPGCIYKGKKSGSFGEAGVFSFVETKNIVIGEGGMIVTNNNKIAERSRLIRNHGEAWMKGKPRKYLSNILGYNFRMTEIHAAIGIEQLKKLDYFNRIRNENAHFLQKELSRFDGVRVLEFGEGEVCHIFAFYLDENVPGISRDKFIALLNSEGIPAGGSYPHPLYMNPIFQEKIAYGSKGCPYTCAWYGKKIDYKKVKCGIAEEACKKLICIRSIHYPYRIKDMKDIVKAFKKIFRSIK